MSRKQGIAVAFKTVATLLMSLWAATSHATTELYYIHTDHLGTPQVMTDKNQDVVWKRSQTPFGETVEESGTLEQPLRFPGQFQDRETGFSYNYYRDYEPGLGRYIQSDPIGLRGGLNAYAYVGGNPLVFIDPFGLEQLNLFSPADLNRPLYEKAPDIPGVLDIYGHGNPSIIADDRNGRRTLSPNEAAQFIRDSGLWEPGMPVRLFQCEAAQGENSFAEQLSESLGEGTIVIGADQLVFPNLKGGLLGTYEPKSWPMSRYPNRNRPGNWNAYENGVPVNGGDLLPTNR